MDCVYCGSGRVIKYGTRGGVQQYRCKMCGRQFNERSGTPFAGMRYTPGEVVLALRLRFNYRLSCREVSELMAEMGHPVSLATVLFWTGRFSDTFQMLQRRYRPDYPDMACGRAPRQAPGREGLRPRRGGREPVHHSHNPLGEEGRGGRGQGAEEGEGGGRLRTGDPRLRRKPGLPAGDSGDHARGQARRRPVQGHTCQPTRTAGHGEQQPPGAAQRHPPGLQIPQSREQCPHHPRGRVQPPQASSGIGRPHAVSGSGRRRANLEHPSQSPLDSSPLEEDKGWREPENIRNDPRPETDKPHHPQHA